MKKIFAVTMLSILAIILSACMPKVPVQCGEGMIEVPLRKAEDYKAVCEPMPAESNPEGYNPPVGNPEVEDEDEAAVEQPKGKLAHLSYWTTKTETERWPNMSQFDIVACHGDPDSNGNAKIVFLIGDIQRSDLVLTYFDGYSGAWSEEAKEQIINEKQDSVRPHVPGFTLTEIEVIHLP